MTHHPDAGPSDAGGAPEPDRGGLHDLDHLGQRRLSFRESAVWYLVAFVTYVLTGMWQKWLLTWFLGPMWLVATVWFGPLLWDAVRGRRRENPA